MVRIEKVTLQGFKSFKKRTAVEFPKNLVAIIGPNGSGKSSIMDAILFAFGCSSQKILKFTSINELLYRGSKNKKEAEYTIVSVYLSNKDRKLPINEDTVVITRRMNKDGKSTFKVNGVIKRKNEVADILAKAGIFVDGHNVLMQGEVDRLTKMNAIERRKIIDEICGISEYDEKKEKAVKQLEKVEEKLKSIEIVLNEKKKMVEEIMKDRELALRYKELSKEKDIIDAIILWREYVKGKDSQDIVNAKINAREKQLKIIDEHIKIVENKKEKLEKEFNMLTEKMAMSDDKIKIIQEINRIESEIKLNQNKIVTNEEIIRRIEAMIEEISRSERKLIEKFGEILNIGGVYGFLFNLIKYDDRYRMAVRTCAAQHYNDIVVEDMDTAIKCIKILKMKKMGKMRFIPLKEIQVAGRKDIPMNCIAWVSDLLSYNPKVKKAIDFVFGRTACTSSIETGKEVFKRERIRIVTLDGDLIERSGVVYGGYESSFVARELKKRISEKRKIEEENVRLQENIEGMKKELNKMREIYKRIESASMKARFQSLRESIEKLGNEIRRLYDKKEKIVEDINKLKVKRARLEASFDDIKEKWDIVKNKIKKDVIDEVKKKSLVELKKRREEIDNEILSLGPINFKAIEKFEDMKREIDEIVKAVEKIMKEKHDIEKCIEEIEIRKKKIFMETLQEVEKNFNRIFKEMVGGEIKLELENNDINSGLLIYTKMGNTENMHTLNSLSGGEKAITALAFLFAIMNFRPSPFYIFDEADAPLDHINSIKFINMLRRYSKDTQIIIISHNNEIIKNVDIVYGVSKSDDESKILSIRF